MMITYSLFLILVMINSDVYLCTKKAAKILYKKISSQPIIISSQPSLSSTSSSSSSITIPIDSNNNDSNDDDDDDDDDDVFKSPIEIRNTKLLISKFKIRPESAAVILDNPRMKTIDIEERMIELHSTIGLTKPKLKVTLDNYPSLAVDMLSSPVKTIKSIIMKKLELTEAEFTEAIRTVQKQNNDRPAYTFFRGNFNFILSILERRLDFKFGDLRKLFKYYPTIFTMDDGLLNHRISFLINLGYSKYELKDMIVSSGRCIFYDDSKFMNLKNFFTSMGMSTREFCTLTTKHPRIISLSLNGTLVAKVDHLRNDSLWNISNQRLCEIIAFAPSALTTPYTTTKLLWKYLDSDLEMDNDSIRKFIDDYPGYLRVNKETLAVKIDYIVISEILLMAYRSNLLALNINENDTNDKKISLLSKLFKSMARRMLEKSGLAFTCSMERLQSRLLFISKKIVHAKNSDDNCNDYEEEVAHEVQHPYENFISDSITLKEGAPMWHKSNETSIFYEIENPHIEGITFLASILTDESILLLKEEWEQVLSKSLMSLLPAPPLHSFLYSETKFNNWLGSRQYNK